jgi:hypothetical protein
MKHKTKKLRGSKNKRWGADHRQWLAETKPKRAVTVSEITDEGFLLHTYRKDYYISRKLFPWFRDATDEEIRIVSLSPDVGEPHGDMLYWRSLDFDIGSNSIENTEWIKDRNIIVRGVHRPDLED